jgi:hypothetical protein
VIIRRIDNWIMIIVARIIHISYLISSSSTQDVASAHTPRTPISHAGAPPPTTLLTGVTLSKHEKNEPLWLSTSTCTMQPHTPPSFDGPWHFASQGGAAEGGAVQARKKGWRERRSSSSSIITHHHHHTHRADAGGDRMGWWKDQSEGLFMYLDVYHRCYYYYYYYYYYSYFYSECYGYLSKVYTCIYTYA